MPKRQNISEEERVRKKIRRYEKKLAQLANQEHESNDDENDNITYYEGPCTIYEDNSPIEYDVPPTPIFHDGGQGMSPAEVLEESAQAIAAQQIANPIQDDLELPPLEHCPGIAPTPCANTTSTQFTPAVDPDLLSALGDCYADTPEWGENIIDDISQRWEPILRSGLTKDVRESLTKKYNFPKNMSLTKPPVLNPEISAVLTETSRNRDVRLCIKQGQLGHALTALGKVMTGLLTKNMNVPEILGILNDAGKIIADSHFSQTETRRSLIVPLLEKSFVTPLKDRKRDSFLFGDNLGDFIKSSRGVKKTGQLITPAVVPIPGNSRSGPQRNQRHQRSVLAGRNNTMRQTYQQRRPQQYQQRRQAPPPPARRNPPAASLGQSQSGPSRPRNANN